MPKTLNEIIQVRRSIGDPVTSDFIVVEELPATPFQNTAYTTGDGTYRHYDGTDWQYYTLKFSDSYIGQLVRDRGQLRAAIRLIDNLIARIDPSDYLTSGNAGGQSVGFPSLSEVMDYYNGLRDKLLLQEAEDAGMDSGLMLETQRSPVAGVLEGNSSWA